MSYSANLESEVINSQFLAVIKPRKKILYSAFTLDTGSVYKVSYTLGPIQAVSITGTALTAGSSSTLSAGQFYYNTTTQVLYIRKSDSGAPGSSDFIVVTYEIYVGTFDSHWYRVPTDSATESVYFDPLIVKAPVISQASTDLLFGFFPTKSTTITLANTHHFFEGVLEDSSFNKVSIKMWHLLGDISTANMRLVYSGLMSAFTYDQETVSIQILDQTNIFDQEYRHITGTSFFANSDFSELDPNYKGRPIRDVYGYVDGFVPVNVDYLLDTPATSDNRIFVVKKGQSNLGTITGSVTTGSSTTVTNLVDAKGFQVGDSVWFDRVSGTDEYKTITAVDYGADTITHSVLSGGAMASGDSCKRSFVGRINIIHDNIIYTPQYGRDYTENTGLANTCSGFTLSASLESNLSMPATFSPNNVIYCRVYGDKSVDTLGGPAFGANDTSIGVLSQGIVILYRIMKTIAGLAESEIDTATFTTLQGTITDTIGFAVPETSRNDFPTYKDLILKILQTLLIRLGKDNSDLWTLKRIAPLGAVTKTIEDDEITRSSIKYSFDYSDIISEMLVEYGFREIPDRIVGTGAGQVSTVSTTSSTASYLHSRKRQSTIKSLHYTSSLATTLCNRISYALGERRGTVSIESKNRFFDTLLGDVIRITREKIPGFVYVEGTNQTRDFVVIETVKSLNKVTMVLDDQKGIEDNSGSW